MNIKYVFLGNANTNKEIGEYPNKPKDNWSQNCKTVFERYCSSQGARVDQRNKVVGEDGNFYFILYSNKIFVLVLADKDYAERDVFSMIDEIIKDNVHLLVDDRGVMNKEGKKELTRIVDSFQKKNVINQLNDDINSIKIEMQNNINKQVNNLEDVNVMEDKAVKIKENSDLFKKNATKLKRLTCWQNCKWTIILGLIVIGLLAIIIVPIAVSSSSSDKNNK
jgi:hypothetical protein